MKNLLLLPLLFCASIALSQQGQVIQGVRVTSPPTIDGTIDEQEWKDVPFVEGLFDLDSGAAYSDGARFWIAYDQNFIYFAAKLTESVPSQIRAQEYRTNVGLSGDDYVELAVDLSGSLSDFNVFQINPRGATNIQLAGGRAAKREWTGEFLAQARITAQGWEAEARIPWQLMRIPAAGPRNIRVNFRRFVARSQRRFAQTYVTQQSNALTPTWKEIELPKQVLDRSVKLLPYAYFGYDRDTDHVLNAGLDLKTALTESVQLVGSVNPDFRNIENQILSLDFSRFERLAGETRPFFQEGRQYLSSQIFASQRIRGFDAGLNVYGKLTDKTSFGLLNTLDVGEEHNLVANVSHDPTPNDSFRATVTSRATPDLNNEAYLLRATRLFGPVSLNLREMGSRDTSAGTGNYRDAIVQYDLNGINAFAVYTHCDPEFRPRLGFFPEVDFKGWEYGMTFAKLFDKGWLNDYGFAFQGTSYDHEDGSPYRRQMNTQFFYTLRGGYFMVLGADWGSFEGVRDERYTISTGFPRGNPYRNFSVNAETGRLAGQDYDSISFGSSYLFGKRLQTSLRHQVVEFDGRREQTILSANYDLGADRSLSGRLVRDGGSTNAYVALRRSGNLGAEYFLILGDPNARSFRPSLILKVVYPLELGGQSRLAAAGERKLITH